MYSKVVHLYTHIFFFILFQILFPCKLFQNIECSSLCYTVGPCWLYLRFINHSLNIPFAFLTVILFFMLSYLQRLLFLLTYLSITCLSVQEQTCLPLFFPSFVLQFWASHLQVGFPGGTSGEEPTWQCRRCRRREFNLWVRKIPWKRNAAPSRIPAWRTPGTEAPRGLRSTGSHRVGHDASNLARVPAGAR